MPQGVSVCCGKLKFSERGFEAGAEFSCDETPALRKNISVLASKPT
jgi:hypothetical protein